MKKVGKKITEGVMADKDLVAQRNATNLRRVMKVRMLLNIKELLSLTLLVIFQNKEYIQVWILDSIAA